MQIRSATDNDQQAWDAYVLEHPQGVAYHRYGWQLAIREAYQHDALYLIAEVEGLICGVLPLIFFRAPFSEAKLTSLPYCDAGGILADSDEISSALLDEAKLWARKNMASGLEIRSCDFGAVGNKTPDRSKVLMVMQLPESSESFMAAMSPKLRSQVKKPLRDGLVARQGGNELINDFYSVFTQNMRDLGSPVHSRNWIKSVVSAYGESARVGVVYTPGGLPAAAGIILLHGQKVSLPWASSLRRFNKLNANMLLYWTFLSFATDQGYKYFDFGRSTPGEGTYRFKEQWGAKPLPLTWTFIGPDGDEQIMFSASAPGSTRKILEVLWRRLPLAFCNFLGPKVRKYISL
jgi:FemAB-related protein (PEP-CTERM system-associated)